MLHTGSPVSETEHNGSNWRSAHSSRVTTPAGRADVGDVGLLFESADGAGRHADAVAQGVAKKRTPEVLGVADHHGIREATHEHTISWFWGRV